MKNHAFDRYQWERDEKKLMHRHTPTLRRWSGSLYWTFLHLYMPFMVHYLTDKYKGRLRHVVIDTIYSAVSLTLLFANVGIGIWFFLYYTPAGVDVRIQTAAEVMSGAPMEIQVVYANPYRDLEDVHMRVELPDGFVAAKGKEHQSVEYEMGSSQKGTVINFPVSGVVFGNVGQMYTVRVTTSYKYLGRWQEEIAFYHFSIKESSFDVSVLMPNAIVYGKDVVGKIRYANRSPIGRKDVDFELVLPKHYTLTRIEKGKSEMNVNLSKRSFRINHVAAKEEGVITFHGYFSYAKAEEYKLSGDQQTEIGVIVHAGVEGLFIETSEQFSQPVSSGTVHVVNPRVAIQTETAPSVAFGDTVVFHTTVRNTGDTPVERVALRSRITGASLLKNKATASVQSASTQVTNTGLGFDARDNTNLPEIERLAPNESADIYVYVPTYFITQHMVSAYASTTGSVYAPEIDTTIALDTTNVQTRFQSHVDLSVSALFDLPDGEHIGYGPFPPQAWRTTSLRALFGLENINNPLSNVRVTAELSNQVEWTDLYSLSSGTALSYNKNNRSVTWNLPSLAPQSDHYGMQFEVLFTPNQWQIGLSPALINRVTVTATDAFTGKTFTLVRNGLMTPKSVVKQSDLIEE